MDATKLFGRVIEKAIKEIRQAELPLYTFAFYHDHESDTVSVCADSAENSNRKVRQINAYNMSHFATAVAEGDLSAASLWQANVGRNLSLGDFVMVNAARERLGAIAVDDGFYLAMIKVVVSKHSQIAALAPSPHDLVLACSGANDEVEYVWSL